MSNDEAHLITTWTRLEPRARGDSLAPSLEARVYDPLWMLARQWQLAEFRGQDAAFPVDVAFTVQVQPLAGYQPPAGQGETIGQYPLEAFAWPEPPTQPTPGASAESGAELLRLLSDNGCSQATISNIVAAYPLTASSGQTADSQGTEYLQLLSGRLPDANQLAPVLRQATQPDGSLPASLGVAAGDETTVMAAASTWLTGLDSFELTTTASTDAWQPSRLEHQFSVTAATAGSATGPSFTLIAPAWPGRQLEWFDFDVSAEAATAPSSLPSLPDPYAPTNLAPAEVKDILASTWTISASGPPHPLTYPGAPNRRYWAFEDTSFNLATVTVSPDDLARMLIVEFASVYGNDWYLQPIPLPGGAMHTVTQLTVTNSFGETESLGPVAPSIPSFGSEPTGMPDWCMFRSTVVQPDGSSQMLNGLFLPPTVAGIESSPPIEEIILIRDDINDIGWAIEHTVLGADERPLDRYSAVAQYELVTVPTTPADDGSTLGYLLETDVPVYYFPLVPDPTGQPTLALLILRRIGSDGQTHDVPPLGELLTALQQKFLFDQELPPEGTTIRRRHFLLRGFDGEVLSWAGRQRLIGGQYGSVPLAFDQILAEPVPPPITSVQAA